MLTIQFSHMPVTCKFPYIVLQVSAVLRHIPVRLIDMLSVRVFHSLYVKNMTQ